MPFNQSAGEFFVFRNPVPGIKVGFSLVEVVVVTGLVLLVSLVAFQTAEVVGQREKEEGLRQALLEMRTAIDRFQQYSHIISDLASPSAPRFPLSLEEMLTKPDPHGGFFLRRPVMNPLFSAFRWEIASRTSLDGSLDDWHEISSPNQGMPDNSSIVDIRCPAGSGTGLNGIPYQNW